jgi:hypothetical protein
MMKIFVALGLGVAVAMDWPTLQTINHQKRPRPKTALPVVQGDTRFETPTCAIVTPLVN